MLTTDQLTIIRERYKKITINCKDCKHPPDNEDYSCKYFGECYMRQKLPKVYAEFITQAREDIPALLDMINELLENIN